MRKALGILGFVAACELAGIIGSVFTTPSIPGWYAGLAKPVFNPPNAVFAPVWTALYALMGLAAFLVFVKGLEKKDVRTALSFFAAQLLLNVLWSVVFFGAHAILGGAVVIVLLWALIALTVSKFRTISRAAGALLLPYLIWVSFAAVLNFAIWRLNP